MSRLWKWRKKKKRQRLLLLSFSLPSLRKRERKEEEEGKERNNKIKGKVPIFKMWWTVRAVRWRGENDHFLTPSLSLSLVTRKRGREEGRKEGKEGVKSWEILTEHFVSFFFFFCIYKNLQRRFLKKIYGAECLLSVK